MHSAPVTTSGHMDRGVTLSKADDCSGHDVHTSEFYSDAADGLSDPERAVLLAPGCRQVGEAGDPDAV
jgi:hypothetical protein